MYVYTFRKSPFHNFKTVKISIVVPVFKKGDRGDIGNYRPISIIPVFGKILESILKPRIVRFVEGSGLLCNSQFGFRPGRGTIDALLHLVGDIVGGFEGGAYVGITLCDLSRAFDCVSHDVMLKKLNTHFGFRGHALTFFGSYLRGRRQCVDRGDHRSEVRPVEFGVPQGSVLGPIFFILYINDLCHFLLPDRCLLYADDTTLIGTDRDLVSLTDKMDALEKRAGSWFCAGSLVLNSDKTQRIVFSSDSKFTSGAEARLLGVTLDDGLTWSAHVTHLCNKISKNIFVLRRLKRVLSTQTLLNVYYALIFSHISYGIVLWGRCAHFLRVFRMQKRAVRVLAGVRYRDHCRPLFKHFGLLTAPCIYIYYTLVCIRNNISDYSTGSAYHNHDTRRASDLRPVRFRLRRSAVNSLPIALYNKLPENLRTLHASQFKRVIKSLLTEQAFYSVEEYLAYTFPVEGS